MFRLWYFFQKKSFLWSRGSAEGSRKVPQIRANLTRISKFVQIGEKTENIWDFHRVGTKKSTSDPKILNRFDRDLKYIHKPVRTDFGAQRSPDARANPIRLKNVVFAFGQAEHRPFW